jgi:hypothetical protein
MGCTWQGLSVLNTPALSTNRCEYHPNSLINSTSRPQTGALSPPGTDPGTAWADRARAVFWEIIGWFVMALVDVLDVIRLTIRDSQLTGILQGRQALVVSG